MANDFIRVRGARQHNLKNIDVDLPRQKLVVLTGVSGSGKSSLAFDTLYAEGQRRYVQSLSAYARQFLDQLEKPDVDFIEGLSPAVAIEQVHSTPNPRSTIATVTEIYDYLRVLYAVAGQPHDPETGEPLLKSTPAEIGQRLLTTAEGARCMVLAPLGRLEPENAEATWEQLRKQGFVRVRMDGRVLEVEEMGPDSMTQASEVEVVIDRLVLRADARQRLMESMETALKWNAREVRFLIGREGEEELLSFTTAFANPRTGYFVEKLTPQHFSFNTHVGACPRCEGVGSLLAPDPGLLVPDESLSIKAGAVKSWWSRVPKMKAIQERGIEALVKHFKVDREAPFFSLPAAFRQALFEGTGDQPIATGWSTGANKRSLEKPYEGLVKEAQRLYENADSEMLRAQLSRYMNPHPCPECRGMRLRKTSLAVRLSSDADFKNDGLNIHEFTSLPIGDALGWMSALRLSEHQRLYVAELQKEIVKRLSFMEQVGLGYLALNRESGTLSGGEMQRIRLATQIGAGLAGVLYVLDEPSIGLHPADTERLIRTLHHLRDLGNTVLVVEHDEAMMRAADHLIELGPGAGAQGGGLIAQGSPDEFLKNRGSLTGNYLSDHLRIEVPSLSREKNQSAELFSSPAQAERLLTVVNACEHNLCDVTVSFPVGFFTCVTGPSGSGKSTLVNRVLTRALQRHFYGAKDEPGHHDSIQGMEFFDKVVVIDQAPIGRSPRSNPATYTGAFTLIRDLFSQLPAARMRGYEAGRFSFNTSGGRCEKCQGDGQVKVDLHFLPDVFVTCDQCQGKRYNAETLEITFKGRNIAEVLEMTVSEAARFFGKTSAIASKLTTLEECGLGYVRLGQPGNTLSGGEAQRIKLATELAKKATGRTLYLLDEPTTGLHFADIQTLLLVLFRLRDAGNTLIVIEHHLDVIRCADWVIDLGPGGGAAGGHLVACGTPRSLMTHEKSLTGKFLAQGTHS